MLNKNHWKIVYGILLMTGFLGCGEGKEKKVAQSIIQAYHLELPSKTKEKREQIIHLNKKADIHLLVVDTIGSQVTIVIGKIGPDFTMKEKLIEKHFTEDEEIVININTLKKGTYIMDFTAIAETVEFEFTIE